MSQTSTPPNPLGDLGRLPAELRNEIYRLSLTSDSRINVFWNYRFKSKTIPNYSRSTDGPSRIVVIKSEMHDIRGKHGRILRTSEVLGINLLNASKAIGQEAVSIAYGLNRFVFFDGLAVEKFFDKIGDKAALVAYVDLQVRCGFTERFLKWKAEKTNKLQSVALMGDPKRIDIGVLQGSGMSKDASSCAEAVWGLVKQGVVTQDYSAGAGAGREHVRMVLPEELQVQRLRRFWFRLNAELQFEVEVDGNVEKQAIKNVDVRNAKFVTLLEKLLREDATRARELEEPGPGVIQEKPRSSRAEDTLLEIRRR